MLCVEELRIEDKDILSEVAELEKSVFSDAWSLKEIESTVKQKQSISAAAKEESRTLGYYLCYSVLDECEIARIAVNQKGRRRGLDNPFFHTCFRSAKTRI